jgi:hypothetical protein
MYYFKSLHWGEALEQGSEAFCPQPFKKSPRRPTHVPIEPADEAAAQLSTQRTTQGAQILRFTAVDSMHLPLPVGRELGFSPWIERHELSIGNLKLKPETCIKINRSSLWVRVIF